MIKIIKDKNNKDKIKITIKSLYTKLINILSIDIVNFLKIYNI